MMDPIDPSLPFQTLTQRAVRPSNAAAGTAFRHATWSVNRSRVIEALTAEDPHRLAWLRYESEKDLDQIPPAPQESNRFYRFLHCGTRPVVLKSTDDPVKYKVACQRCHDRFCLPCMQDRARLIVMNLKNQLPYAPTRFLTLTLKHSDEPLTDQLDRLYSSFLALRKRRFWLDAVTGGISFLELKLASTDGRWHPHLHVLLRGTYLPRKQISDAWLQITGDSHIVDIQMARSSDHVYYYLTRYITKGWDSGMYRKLHNLREAIQALKSRKLLCSFGDFSRLRLLKPPDSTTWAELGTLQEIVTLAASRVAWAMTACAAIFARSYTPPVDDVPADP